MKMPMHEIRENTGYTANNLITFREKATASQLQLIMGELNDYIKSTGAHRTGCIISTIHTLYMATGEVDVEVFVPLDREIPSCGKFASRGVLELDDCLATYFNGAYCFLPEFYTDIYRWAKNNKIEIEQPFYIVHARDPDALWGMASVEAEIYVRTKES